MIGQGKGRWSENLQGQSDLREKGSRMEADGQEEDPDLTWF